MHKYTLYLRDEYIFIHEYFLYSILVSISTLDMSRLIDQKPLQINQHIKILDKKERLLTSTSHKTLPHLSIPLNPSRSA